MMREPHPFARFVRILGRGKSMTRSLTQAEAEEAMTAILAGEVLPEQLGAFLLLLRVKEESPEELAGFVRAARAALALPATPPRVDLDWSSYAGKRRQLPWFLLSALLLAQKGWRVFMHGGEGHTEGRLYTSEALRSLGVAVAPNLMAAAQRLEREGFAYVTLDAISPALDDMMGLKPVLGLRSPVHTFARLLNPFGAGAMMQAVFHPAYMRLHREAGLLLGQPALSVFRGEGGEIERRPNKPCDLQLLIDGERIDETWPASMPDPRQGADESMDLARLGAVWRGEAEDEYAQAAIVGTTAIALRTLGADGDPASAERHAHGLWSARNRAQLQSAV